MLFSKYPRCTTMASAAVVALFVAGSPALADEHGHSSDDPIASQESSGDAQSTKTIEDKGSNDTTASGGMESFGDAPATADSEVETAGEAGRSEDWLDEADDDATNDEWLAESADDEVTPADAMEPGDYDSAGDATSQDGTIAGETGTYDDDAADPDATASEGVVMHESDDTDVIDDRSAQTTEELQPVIPDSTRSTGPGESTYGESVGDEMEAAGDEVKAAASHTASETSDKWIQTKIESTFAMEDETSAWDIDTEVEGGIVWLHGTVDSESEKQRAETLARDIEGVQEVRNELEVSPESVAMGEDDDTDDAMAATGDDEELGIDNSEVNGDETMDADDNVAATEEDASDIYASSDENELATEEEGLEDEASGVATAAGDATMTAKVKTKLLTADDIAGTDINVDVANGVVTLRGRVSSEEERMRALELARSVEDVQSVEDELVVRASD